MGGRPAFSHVVTSPRLAPGRVVTDGKYLSLDGAAFRVRGATYGTFRPRGDGALFPDRALVERDFCDMAAAGLNTVRTYTLPPADVLDVADALGLRLLVGLDYEDWRGQPTTGRTARRRVLSAGRSAVAEAMAACAGRPSVLAVLVGNEVPADVVRLHGPGAVQDTLSTLVAEVHAADPDMLAGYANFPTTEYLHVEGQDLVCFNVFLERPDLLRRYLRHLQVISGDLPLVVTELGLAAELHGETGQASALGWQLALVDESGCAGATVFAWTDEWAVAGKPVEGWGFGLTDGQRRHRPALPVAAAWARTTVRDLRETWPRISVVVCAYNEERTIEECLSSLRDCDYPDLEVIVCDDGSSDRTLSLATQFPFRVLSLPHGGLSAARNAGLAAATGDIVAYLDADASCHAEWPYRLAVSFDDGAVVATGGPNLPVPRSGLVERAVAASPGGPAHVLLTDDRAEHVPGCNMAFRTDVLRAIGGFDVLYRTAGDDVDVCWKLLDRGEQIAFAPAAQVRHHRRSTVAGFLRQQRGYGRAERMLASQHRHRFNRLGQAMWAGGVYGPGQLLPSLLRPLVYHGTRGAAAFQPVVVRRSERAHAWLSARLPLTVPLGAAGLLLALASRWFLLLPAAAGLVVLGYVAGVFLASRPPRDEPHPAAFRSLVALLHLVQPFARAAGRLTRRPPGPVPDAATAWTGDRLAWLAAIERRLAAAGRRVRHGGQHVGWDLEVSTPLLRGRLTTAVAWGWEPRFRLTVRPRMAAAVAALLAVALTAAGSRAGPVLLVLMAIAALVDRIVLARVVRRCIAATGPEGES